MSLLPSAAPIERDAGCVVPREFLATPLQTRNAGDQQPRRPGNINLNETVLTIVYLQSGNIKILFTKEK